MYYTAWPGGLHGASDLLEPRPVTFTLKYWKERDGGPHGVEEAAGRMEAFRGTPPLADKCGPVGIWDFNHFD